MATKKSEKKVCQPQRLPLVWATCKGNSARAQGDYEMKTNKSLERMEIKILGPVKGGMLIADRGQLRVVNRRWMQVMGVK
jgi:hypothetical protein